MNIYTEEYFNDFAVHGKRSFSLGKILEASVLKEETEHIDEEEQQNT